MTVQELQEKAWKIDRIRVAIFERADASVEDYTWQNAAQGNWSVTEYLNNRIRPLIGKEIALAVFLGNGDLAHGRTLLSSVRDSYNR